MTCRYYITLIAVIVVTWAGVSIMDAEAKDRLTLYCSPQIDWCQFIRRYFRNPKIGLTI